MEKDKRIFIYDNNNNLMAVTAESKNIAYLLRRVYKTLMDFGYYFEIGKIKFCLLNGHPLDDKFILSWYSNSIIGNLKHSKPCNLKK